MLKHSDTLFQFYLMTVDVFSFFQFSFCARKWVGLAYFLHDAGQCLFSLTS
jgi:hypothetical protein